MGKTLRKIAIPEPLRKFLRQVHAKIEAGDEPTSIESDDLLQDHLAYSVFLGYEAGLFRFCYFPGAYLVPTWDFRVALEEIRRIATGETDHLSLWKCDDPACACLYESEDAYCDGCARQNSN